MAKQKNTPEEKAAKPAKTTAARAAEKAATEESARENTAVEETPLSPATAYATSQAELAAREASEKAAAEKTAHKTAESKAERMTPQQKAGEQILADYPDAAEVFVTAEGFGFFRVSDARNHAATLRDKTIIHVKRK
ncbi:hypothetical protein [Alistipes sp.]|uniref:hypothetical protein n=1 Tax=Alistipes sp. TaxID=1872444 RepID=UPI003AB4AAC7